MEEHWGLKMFVVLALKLVSLQEIVGGAYYQAEMHLGSQAKANVVLA